MQGETNIHNLIFFNGSDIHDIPKTGISLWLTGARIFSLFWFSYCFFIPVINALSSKARDLFIKIRFPVIPVWIGIVFLSNHLISKGFEALDLFRQHHIVEIKETNFAFLFLVVSISLYANYKNDGLQRNIDKYTKT